MAPVTLVISDAVKPSLENSSWRALTSDALKRVVQPSSRALSLRFLNSLAVAPLTAFTLAMLLSKSAAALKLAARPKPEALSHCGSGWPHSLELIGRPAHAALGLLQAFLKAISIEIKKDTQEGLTGHCFRNSICSGEGDLVRLVWRMD